MNCCRCGKEVNTWKYRHKICPICGRPFCGNCTYNFTYYNIDDFDLDICEDCEEKYGAYLERQFEQLNKLQEKENEIYDKIVKKVDKIRAKLDLDDGY